MFGGLKLGRNGLVEVEDGCAVLEFPPFGGQPGFGCQAATAGAVGRVLSQSTGVL